MFPGLKGIQHNNRGKSSGQYKGFGDRDVVFSGSSANCNKGSADGKGVTP